jgi:adenylate kinase family enzyme
MSFDNLTSDNMMMYAIKAYDKPNCILSEFSEDMKRFNYLKRLFRRYRKHNEMRERLVLNHLVVLNNVFGAEVLTRLLFFDMSESDYPQLKTYLLFLSCMPDVVRGINGKDIISSDIEVDLEIANVLRTIK